MCAVNVESLFAESLTDLGRHNRRYAGILTPEVEIGRPKRGVADSLLVPAEEYFRKFQQYDYCFSVLGQAISGWPKPPSGIALDLGSGFGNTVLPLLESYPELFIIASDISPDLLAILRREAMKRGLLGRCATVAMDLHGDYFRPGIADYAFGFAILHHLIEPMTALKSVVKALRRGARAVFVEPFQAGHAMARIAYEQILAEAGRRGTKGRGFDFLLQLIRDIHVRTHQEVLPDTGMPWAALDDKWLFTRTHFERLGAALKISELRIEQLHTRSDMFSNQTRIALVQYGGLTAEDLPDWAWEIMRRFDDEYCSAELKLDLVMEGIITFVR